MKPYILALFACSVVAVGQSKLPTASVYPPPCKAPDKAVYVEPETGTVIFDCIHWIKDAPKPKPHKAKTPAKPKEKPLHWEGDPGPMPSGFVAWDVKLQDPQTPAKPAEKNFTIHCEGPCQQPLVSSKDSLEDHVKPSDLSATMEQVAPTKDRGVDDKLFTDWKPKACDEICNLYLLRVEGNRPNFQVDIRCDDASGKDCFHPDAVIVSTENQTVAKLADEEYAHLQQLRSAVVEEEKRLAVKYGANFDKVCPAWHPGELVVCNAAVVQPDHYEFHGQFLLIEKGSK